MKGAGMMSAIIEPYTEAYMSIAQSQNLVDRFSEDVRYLLDLLKDSEDLRQFIANPLIKAEAKKAVIRQIAGEQVHSYTLNFLSLLIERRRIGLLEGICQQFLSLVRKLNQTVLAEVISVVPLTEAQQQAIQEKVVAMTGARQVEFQTQIDPELIGGVIVKVGSQVIDASLRGQLRRIGIRLSTT